MKVKLLHEANVAAEARAAEISAAVAAEARKAGAYTRPLLSST